MHLDQGATYRGRGIVSSPVGVSHENAKSRLEEKGFSNVTVWLAGDHLPADWPVAQAKDESGALSTQVWVEATWGQPSGEIEASGTGWEVVDIWGYGSQEQLPGDPFCGTEGYSCDLSALGGSTGCCISQECKQDDANEYGGGPRCQPRQAVVQTINPVSTGTSWVWWALGVGVVGVAGWWSWPYLAKAFGGRTAARANPTYEAQHITEMQDLLRRFGYDPADAKALHDEGMGPEELEHRLRTAPGPGVGSLGYTHRIQKRSLANPSKAKTMFFRAAWLPSWPASGARWEHGPIRMTYEEAQKDEQKGNEWANHPNGSVLNGRFADSSEASRGLKHGTNARGVCEIHQHLYG